MDNLICILTVFGLAINIGNISSCMATVADQVLERDTALGIPESPVVRSKRYMAYYDDDEYTEDDSWRWHRPPKNRHREIHQWWNGTHRVKTWCIPSRRTCAFSYQCCTRDCEWFFGNVPGVFNCADGICPYPDGTYRPCRDRDHDRYVVEYNYFSPNRPLYPPPGKPVTPW